MRARKAPLLDGGPTRCTAKRRAVAAAALAAVALGVGAYETGALAQLEAETVQARFRLRGAKTPTDVAVVAVDDKTFSELGVQWPFPRRLHAEVIDALRRAHVRRVVYDVQFTEPSDPADDLALFTAVGRARGVVLATTEVDAHGHTDVLGGDANLRRVGALAAASNLPAGQGGVIYRYPYSLLGLRSLAVATADMSGHPLSTSRFEGSQAWIDFRGPPGTIKTYSFSDVLHGRVKPSALAGRVVVVGAAAPTLQDVHQTATATTDPMSGPEIQANAAWTALHGNPLRSGPPWLALLALVAGGLIAPLASLRLKPLLCVLAALAAAGAYLTTSQLAFDGGVVLSVAYPIGALLVGAVGMVTAHYVGAFVERNAFSRQLQGSQLELVQRLAQAVESRDVETGAHIRRIGILCENLARAIGWSAPDAEMLRHASAMHDVGKIGIPDRVLLKPGKLDADEWKVVQAHTTIGGEILADSANPLVTMAEDIARSHHERWDGSGYPDGLAGDRIPLVARICSVCDVYDALVSQRSYKDSWKVEEALAEITRCSGTQFDPALVEAFLKIVPTLNASLGEARGTSRLVPRSTPRLSSE